MNIQVISGSIGRILIIFALFMLVPLLVAVFQQEHTRIAFLAPVLVTAGAGGLLLRCGKQSQAAGFGIRECFAIVAGTWMVTSLTASLPFYLAQSVPTFLDALFEAVSGLSTTGATVIADVEALPDSILLWRSMTQWLGGLGIVVLFIAFLPAAGKGGMTLFQAEYPGPKPSRVLPRLHDTAAALWILYVSLTVIQVILLKAAGMSWFESLNHTFATVATGGFSTRNASIQHFDSIFIEVIISVFAFICGGNFTLYFFVWKSGISNLFRDTEFRVYAAITAVAFALTAGSLIVHANIDVWTSARVSLFQVVSVMTSTGFTTVNYDEWPSFAKTILFILMFTGGCAGSTAAGIKIIRLIILYKQAAGEISKILHPRVVHSIVISRKPVEAAVIGNTMNYLLLYIGVFMASALIVSATGLSTFDAMAAVAASLGNVGPSFGPVGPTATYGELAPSAKFVLTLNMILGRLEIFPLLILFYPDFWQSLFNRSRESGWDRIDS